MTARFRFRPALFAAGLIVAASGLGAGGAGAQDYANPNRPRSPYGLPQPRYVEPDIDELVEGNGRLHASGQWRHWGDSRNSGELFQSLFAPNGVVDVPEPR